MVHARSVGEIGASTFDPESRITTLGKGKARLLKFDGNALVETENVVVVSNTFRGAIADGCLLHLDYFRTNMGHGDPRAGLFITASEC